METRYFGLDLDSNFGLGGSLCNTYKIMKWTKFLQ